MKPRITKPTTTYEGDALFFLVSLYFALTAIGTQCQARSWLDEDVMEPDVPTCTHCKNRAWDSPPSKAKCARHRTWCWRADHELMLTAYNSRPMHPSGRHCNCLLWPADAPLLPKGLEGLRTKWWPPAIPDKTHAALYRVYRGAWLVLQLGPVW